MKLEDFYELKMTQRIYRGSEELIVVGLSINDDEYTPLDESNEIKLFIVKRKESYWFMWGEEFAKTLSFEPIKTKEDDNVQEII